MKRISALLAGVAVMSFVSARASATTEICGNDIDDDGNGLTDEGCYQTLSTGVCESPLSCADTGMVSWSTGSLHYDLPPDIAPAVPYGASIGFRRYFMSMSTPGSNPTSVNKTPLGPGWGHTYLTWIDRYTAGGSERLVWHTSQGRDTYYTDAGSASGWETYTPQAGEYVMSMKRNLSSPYQYNVQLLTGETIVYNSYGQVTEIWDTEPTPNKVLVTWDATTNGNVSTVTDASGERRLSFSYSNGLMTSVQFQLLVSGTWTTEQTTTYDYSNGVSRDATSGWYVPANASQWTQLLQGTGISNPSHLYLAQEASGNLADSIGAWTLSASGTPSYRQTVTGWSTKSVQTNGSGAGAFQQANALNLGTTSMLALGLVSYPTQPGGTAFTFGTYGTNLRTCVVTPSLSTTIYGLDWGSVAFGSMDAGSGVHPVAFQVDVTHSKLLTETDEESVSPSSYPATTSGSDTFFAGTGATTGTEDMLYAAVWTGSNAELSGTQVTKLINLMKYGPGLLTSVTIGGQGAQQYTYSGTELTKITDDAGNLIAGFSYSSTVVGQVDLVNTPRGTVGFEYASSRAACSGDTILYFNQGNPSSCGSDSDCGTGYLCGGKTGSGSTGTCFLAGRCMTNSTVNGESVVTNIAPLGPGGGSGTCTGACLDVMQYAWSSASGQLNVTGREDPNGSYTSIAYCTTTSSGCTAGMPYQVQYGDNDADPTNTAPSGVRNVFMTYDSTFPGRLATTRRPSDIDSSKASCTSKTSTSGCVITSYTYDGSNQLSEVDQTGDTLNGSGSIVSFHDKTVYSHDSKARLTEVDVEDGSSTILNKTTYDYYGSGSDPTSDNFLEDYKMYTGSTTYLEPQVIKYDFWGHPTGVKAPDGNVTCDTYDSARGTLTSRRRAMNGQTDCTTTNGLDLTTSWVRDSALRLTQLTRPDGSCLFYSYDSTGRLYQSKRRDDCNAASAGDYQQWSYTADSQVNEIDTYDDTSTITASRIYTYLDGRQLNEIVNPNDTSKFTGLVYDGAGQVTEVDGASSLSKTTYTYNADHRVTAENRYTGASTYDTWSLLYSWIGGQSQVEDGDSKITSSVRDDLNRLVEINSPDLAYPTVRVYDDANRVTSVVEAEGGGSAQETHTFTFDEMNRSLNDDYSGSCAVSGGGAAQPEIQRTYDALPIGVSCPAGAGHCNNLTGRLAVVKASLMCASAYATSDGSLDQFTYYSYDDAGRVVEEYVVDDSGRVADHQYSYTKNGALAQVTLPSGTVLGWSYGSSSGNSDTDLISSIWRGSAGTPVVDTVEWAPFGPWMQYNWESTIGGTGLENRVTRDLAYKINGVRGAEYQTGASPHDAVGISLDAKERVTSRHYTTFTGLSDSYFLYDEQDRVTCETTTSIPTCPASGGGSTHLKNGHTLSPPFMHAGDWKFLRRPIAGSTAGYAHDFDGDGSAYGSSHQITDVDQSDGTPSFGQTGFTYDARGNRTLDDNLKSLTDDARYYTYDARRNVVNVRGQYYNGSAWHYYDVASAFDAQNRRVFKSFYDETTTKTATWFFYYDSSNRLTEVRYTPDTSASSTYSLFQLFWLNQKLVAYWQTDYPSVTTSKRYVTSDETDRPIKMWNWPASGDATIVWAINPSAWGMDTNLTGSSMFQPILFAGQYQDAETAAYENDGATIHRPGLALNGYRTYDPFVGGYLQMDPLADRTWSSYVYAESDPVGADDPNGLIYTDPNNHEIIEVNDTIRCTIDTDCWGDSSNPFGFNPDGSRYTPGSDPGGGGGGGGWPGPGPGSGSGSNQCLDMRGQGDCTNPGFNCDTCNACRTKCLVDAVRNCLLSPNRVGCTQGNYRGCTEQVVPGGSGQTCDSACTCYVQPPSMADVVPTGDISVRLKGTER